VLTVREATAADADGIAALLAATADRVAALDPAARFTRAPEPGPGLPLVAVDGAGTVHGYVRVVPQELGPDDGERMWHADRSAAWADVAVAGPEAAAALAAAVRATPAGAGAEALLWPAADEPAAAWWAGAGLEHAFSYALRPPVPLPGALPAGVTARPAGPDDADAVVALHREAVGYQATVIPYVRLLPAGEADFRARLLSGETTTTVLDAGDRLLGVCEWWLVDGGMPALPPGRYAYLNSVGVAAGARAAGLGRALAGAALAAAGDGLDGSTLWFSPFNPIASRVWPRLGWRPIWSAWERRS
jgi:GNAT superfamily N-acetyltransferase